MHRTHRVPHTPHTLKNGCFLMSALPPRRLPRRRERSAYKTESQLIIHKDLYTCHFAAAARDTLNRRHRSHHNYNRQHITCSSLLMRSRAVLLTWRGNSMRPARMFWYLQYRHFARLNSVVKLGVRHVQHHTVFREKGRVSHEHFVQEDTQRPPINRLAVAFVEDDFGCEVLWCAAQRPRP